MKYRISVVQIDNFTEEELKQMRERETYRQFRGDLSFEHSEKTIRTLDVTLTEDEWKAVKRAVVEVM